MRGVVQWEVKATDEELEPIALRDEKLVETLYDGDLEAYFSDPALDSGRTRRHSFARNRSLARNSKTRRLMIKVNQQSPAQSVQQNVEKIQDDIRTARPRTRLARDRPRPWRGVA